MVTEEGKALLLLCHTSYLLWQVVHNRFSEMMNGWYL